METAYVTRHTTNGDAGIQCLVISPSILYYRLFKLTFLDRKRRITIGPPLTFRARTWKIAMAMVDFFTLDISPTDQRESPYTLDVLDAYDGSVIDRLIDENFDDDHRRYSPRALDEKTWANSTELRPHVRDNCDEIAIALMSMTTLTGRARILFDREFDHVNHFIFRDGRYVPMHHVTVGHDMLSSPSPFLGDPVQETIHRVYLEAAKTAHNSHAGVLR